MNINEIEVDYKIVKPIKLLNKIDIRFIKNIVCGYFKISQDELLQRNRKRYIKDKRQIFHYLCVKYTNETLAEIGKYEGYNFGHATVINSNKKVENFIDTEKKFREIIYDLELKVREFQIISLYKDDFRTIKYNLSRDIINCENYSELQSIFIKYMLNNN